MTHQYIIMFLSLLVGGESILIPAIYLTLIDVWSVTAVVILALIATIISDSWWYIVGRRVPLEKIKNMRGLRKNKKALDRASALFKKYGVWCIIFSKFIYGTRIAVQVLAGIERIPYLTYTAVNTLAVGLWIAALYGLGTILRQSLDGFQLSILMFQIIFGSLFLVFIGLALWINYAMSKKKFQ